MKKNIIKVILAVCLIFSTFSCYRNDSHKKSADRKTVIIASFNTLRLGEKEKDYRTLARIISKYDLTGLQEVMNEKGLKKLKGHLEKLTKEKWEYIISEKPAGTENYREYYGYIYRKSLFSEVYPLGFYKEKNENEFMREPYGAYFKIGNFDFVYILAHSIFGDSERQRLIEGAGYINVYEYFIKESKEEDVILAGDFNLPANSPVFRNMNLKYNIEFLIDPLENPTTISDNKLANSYDNFFLNKEKTKEFNGNCGVYNFIKENNYKDIRKYISDHLPIYSEYDIADYDDD